VGAYRVGIIENDYIKHTQFQNAEQFYGFALNTRSEMYACIRKITAHAVTKQS